MDEKRFRADLFYRLQVFTLTVPPLRQRRTDILPLAEFFLRRFSLTNGLHASGFSDDAVLLLQQHSYPGNVRELQHLVEHAAVLAVGRVITADLLRQSLPPAPSAADCDDHSLSRLLQLPFHESVAAWERRLISTALQSARGNKADAARRLGIQRRLLYEKLRTLELEPPEE